MSERVTDKDLREWHKLAAGFAMAWPSSTVYAMADELLALRARITELEAERALAERYERERRPTS
jgi:hypothetical protein